jgi:hypothetical protein
VVSSALIAERIKVNPIEVGSGETLFHRVLARFLDRLFGAVEALLDFKLPRSGNKAGSVAILEA